MNIDYIELLEYNNTDKLYDLTITTFTGNIQTSRIGYFAVGRRHEMRMDLVSIDLYGTNKWTGTLCTLNNIFNVFSIKEGDVLIYLPVEDMSNLNKVPDNIKYGTGAIAKTKDAFINAIKNKKIDKSRANFLSKRDNVNEYPPSLATTDTPDIQVIGGKIVISSPIKTPNENVKETTIKSDETVSSLPVQEETITRVLVNQYIKYINK